MKREKAMIKSILVAAALALALILVLAGCGSGGGSGNASGSASGSATSQQESETIAATKNSELGKKILVDEDGKTLYLFEKDRGGKSTCSGACAQAWPPVTTEGKPQVGKGASASKLGTTTRNDGSTQVTYNGHPLYYYASDNKPGELKGEGLEQFGAEWYVLSPQGNKVEEEQGGSGSKSSSGGGSGGSGGGY